jgi:short-chain Z-isoprenyl diphosphate synthase
LTGDRSRAHAGRFSAGLGVRMVTLWVFSPDNLRRREAEIGGIFGAVEAKMRALAADPRHIAAMGRRDLLPPALLEAIDAAEAATRGNNQITVTLAIGYGGREEIADAVRAFLNDCVVRGLSTAEAASLVGPEAIRRHLYLCPTQT